MAAPDLPIRPKMWHGPPEAGFEHDNCTIFDLHDSPVDCDEYADNSVHRMRSCCQYGPCSICIKRKDTYTGDVLEYAVLNWDPDESTPAGNGAWHGTNFYGDDVWIYWDRETDAECTCKLVVLWGVTEQVEIARITKCDEVLDEDETTPGHGGEISGTPSCSDPRGEGVLTTGGETFDISWDIEYPFPYKRLRYWCQNCECVCEQLCIQWVFCCAAGEVIATWDECEGCWTATWADPDNCPSEYELAICIEPDYGAEGIDDRPVPCKVTATLNNQQGLDAPEGQVKEITLDGCPGHSWEWRFDDIDGGPATITARCYRGCCECEFAPCWDERFCLSHGTKDPCGNELPAFWGVEPGWWPDVTLGDQTECGLPPTFQGPGEPTDPYDPVECCVDELDLNGDGWKLCIDGDNTHLCYYESGVVTCLCYRVRRTVPWNNLCQNVLFRDDQCDEYPCDACPEAGTPPDYICLDPENECCDLSTARTTGMPDTLYFTLTTCCGNASGTLTWNSTRSGWEALSVSVCGLSVDIFMGCGNGDCGNTDCEGYCVSFENATGCLADSEVNNAGNCTCEPFEATYVTDELTNACCAAEYLTDAQLVVTE